MGVEVVYMDIVTTISEFSNNVRSNKPSTEAMNHCHVGAKMVRLFGLTVRCFGWGFERCLD
jgi:hypothetical protein